MSDLGGSHISETCGTPDDVSMGRYRAWHVGQGLALIQCEVHCSTRRAVCESTDSSKQTHRHLCNGHYSCQPID